MIKCKIVEHLPENKGGYEIKTVGNYADLLSEAMATFHYTINQAFEQSKDLTDVQDAMEIALEVLNGGTMEISKLYRNELHKYLTKGDTK